MILSLSVIDQRSLGIFDSCTIFSSFISGFFISKKAPLNIQRSPTVGLNVVKPFRISRNCSKSMDLQWQFPYHYPGSEFL